MLMSINCGIKNTSLNYGIILKITAPKADELNHDN
jgi:hypothetical protein